MNMQWKNSIYIFLFLVIFQIVGISTMQEESVFAAGDPIIFQVNKIVEGEDTNIGDGICADADDNCTLRAAIQEANAYTGDKQVEIRLPAGTYSPVYPLGQYTLKGNISIVGAGEDQTVIAFSKVYNSRILEIENGAEVSISGVTLTGGRAFGQHPEARGGAIRNRGTLLLSDVTITDSASFYMGGAIYNESGGEITLKNSTIKENGEYSMGYVDFVGQGGGIYQEENAFLTMINSSVINNTADFGGGIYNSSGTVVIENSTISGNNAEQSYGGIYSTGSLGLIDSEVSGNTAIFNGGGIYFGFNGGELTIESSEIINNSAENGGGIYVYVHRQSSDTSSLSVIDSHISGNEASNDGGGMYIGLDSSGDIVSMESNHIVGNDAGNKGASLFNPTPTPIQAKHNWWGSQGSPIGNIEGEAIVFPWSLDENMSEQASDSFQLERLTILNGAIDPAFSPEINHYQLNPVVTDTLELRGIVADSTSSLSINGNPAVSGEVTSIPLELGANTINITVTTKDNWTNVYTLEVSRTFKSFEEEAHHNVTSPSYVTVGSDGIVYHTFNLSNDNMIYRRDSSLGFLTNLSLGFGYNSLLGVAVDEEGFMYVTNPGTGNHRLVKSTVDGTVVEQTEGYGQGDGEFNAPRGLAIDDEYIYVVDSQNRRIQIFNMDLEYQSQFEFKEGDLIYAYPEDIAVSQDGFIYVVYNVYGNQVVKFDKSGNQIDSWGEQGSGNGQFNSPTGIAIDNDGYVYVADRSNDRVQIFDENGNYVSEIDSLNQPRSVAFDTGGNLYVASSEGITKFRTLSNDATLQSLQTSEGDLQPTFSPNETNYSIEVDNEVKSLELTAEVNDSESVITVNSIEYDSGDPILVELEEGINPVTIQVRAESGSVIDYQVEITRKQAPRPPVSGGGGGSSPSSNADLEQLDLIGDEEELVLTPPFSSEITTYRAQTKQDKIKLQAMTANTSGKITLNGEVFNAEVEVELQIGENSFEFIVEAENGTQKTYLVIIERREGLVLPPVEFTDIANHWAKDFINEAVALGIIKGYPDGTYKPENNLTRTHAVSILVRAFGLKTEEESPFPDIGMYAEETQAEIAAAYKYGLVKGSNGNFMPSKNVTRAQMALMLHRAYEYKTGKKYIASEIAPYPDFGSYDDETIHAISMLYELEIATGSNGKYMPNNPTTRAHAAKMFVNYMNYMNYMK